MAYVTVLSTDGYLPGVLVLDESLRLCRSKYPLYVVVGEGVSGGVRDTLARAGLRQIETTSLNIPSEILAANVQSDYHRHWAGVFDKLSVFSLCQFQKIVYIDSDVLVVRNLDELFARPHMSAVIADKIPGRDVSTDLNAGLMVIEPEQGLTDRLTSLLPEAFEQEKKWRSAAGRPASMGVQSVINMFWQSWITNHELQLDGKYNVLANHLDYYVRELGYRWRGPDGIHLLHFVGEVKPWTTTGVNFARLVAKLLTGRRVWELAALLSYLAVLGAARLRLLGRRDAG